MKVSFLVAILLQSSLQIFPHHGDNPDWLTDMKSLTVSGQGAAAGSEAGDRYSHVFPLVLFFCHFVPFLYNFYHHIYCPSKRKCYNPVHFLLVLVHCPTSLFIVVVWLSLKLCFSNFLCLVLPPLLDILLFVQLQTSPLFLWQLLVDVGHTFPWPYFVKNVFALF